MIPQTNSRQGSQETRDSEGRRCIKLFNPRFHSDGHLVHFGVVLGLNLMIGALTPPMGILFYIVSDVGRVPVEKVIKELWPFLFPLGIVLGIITYFPTVVTWLPTLIFK
jgi:TRAP-type C4-dicarboxylate transport system permease large subunit